MKLTKLACATVVVVLSTVLALGICLGSYKLGVAVRTALNERAALNRPAPPVTPQQLASHRIKIKGGGLCSATAIGPHALLTAVHCNPDDLTTLNIDLSTKDFHILAKTVDGRDHVIYILDGAAFTNTAVLLHGDLPVELGERVYLYGSGGGIYPPQLKEGVRCNCIADHSDVDAADGLAYYTVPTIPGDSGSALYANDGHIVAVTTYGVGYPKDGDYANDDDDNIIEAAGDFDVDFTEAQVDAAVAGFGDVDLSSKAPAPPKKRSIFDLFSNLPQQ